MLNLLRKTLLAIAVLAFAVNGLHAQPSDQKKSGSRATSNSAAKAGQKSGSKTARKGTAKVTPKPARKTPRPAAKKSVQSSAARRPQPSTGNPYEGRAGTPPTNPIDGLVRAALRAKGIQPALQSSDEVFVRRAYLDIIGTLPTVEQVRAFLAAKGDKRTNLIDQLMKREEFAIYWAMKWCDILRVKAEFPINLWPNGVQAYHRWLLYCLQNNVTFDVMARQMLTSSGSNFRVPSTNFYRAVQGEEPSTLASAAALTFMGTRVDGWTDKERANLEVFFSHIAFKGTAEWKETITSLDPAPRGPIKAVFPDGTKVTIKPDEDPRVVFANWLITPENEYFAKNIVNRVWSWLMGRGIIHEPDDIRKDNPPINPKLLAYLEKKFIESGCDLRALYRLILTSQTYQQSSIPRSNHPDVEKLNGVYIVRRLEAEVLIDALCMLYNSTESYQSAIPEPFTFIPTTNRTIALADGSITSQFLEMFGRPSRDTGLESERNNKPSDPQRLHLLNSTHIQLKIDRSTRMANLIRLAKNDRNKLVTNIYLTVLSRMPTEQEKADAIKYLSTKGLGLRQGVADLAWSMTNSKEFLFRH